MAKHGNHPQPSTPPCLCKHIQYISMKMNIRKAIPGYVRSLSFSILSYTTSSQTKYTLSILLYIFYTPILFFYYRVSSSIFGFNVQLNLTAMQQQQKHPTLAHIILVASIAIVILLSSSVIRMSVSHDDKKELYIHIYILFIYILIYIMIYSSKRKNSKH